MPEPISKLNENPVCINIDMIVELVWALNSINESIFYYFFKTSSRLITEYWT